MSSRLRPRSASLKALPPDSPCSPSIEGCQTGTGAQHWNVHPKEKPGPAQRHRPLKSVSLKLAKGDSPTASTRSNSAGAPFGDLLLDARQCARQAHTSSNGPPSRGSSGEVIANLASTGAQQSAKPGQTSRSRTNGSGDKMVSTAPAAVGRPPPHPKQTSSGEALTTSNRLAQLLQKDIRTVSEDEDGLARPSSASYQRAAAVYASLPKTPGGTRTLVPDADGFIFRPSVEAEPKPMPRGRPRPVSRGIASLTAVPARASLASLHNPASKQAEEPPAPRIAWSEGSQDAPPGPASDDMLAAAAEIRREWLARQLMGEEAEAAGDDDSDRWHLRTADGQRSLGELEKSLAKAKERAETNRRELAGYLEALRNKTFQATDDSSITPEEELLVTLPVDFEDVVDINASLAAVERRKSGHRVNEPSGASAHSKNTSQGPAGDRGERNEDFRLPAFLEKYFFEEKAVEELPIVRIQAEEAAGDSKESSVDKISRQIGRLDALLARREADGMARLKASKAELEATKDRLRKDSEKSAAEKLELLKQLKEKGFLRSASRATSAASSVQPSRSSSLAPSGVATPSGEASIDWSAWESSAEVDAGSGAQYMGSAFDRPSAQEDEPDTSTFSLTSETADLTNLEGHVQQSSSSRSPRHSRAASRASRHLQPVLEDVAVETGHNPGDVAEAPEEAEEQQELQMLGEDPYNWEAIRAIDDKLAQLVPESEWEAKSIRSLPSGSDISAAGLSKTSQPSVRSSALSSSVLPGEHVLREQCEDRENRKALIAIDDRISQLQDEMQRRPSENLRPEQLGQLLLQAAAAQPVPAVDDKVLSLQAGTLDALVNRQSTDLLEDAGVLSKAREILARLEQSQDDLDEAAVTASSSWGQVEDSLRVLEEQSSLPRVETEVHPSSSGSAALAEVSTWATRLEDLGKEASDVAANGVPSARGTLPLVDVDAFVKGDWTPTEYLVIPTLSSAVSSGTAEGPTNTSPALPILAAEDIRLAGESGDSGWDDWQELVDEMDGNEVDALASAGDDIASEYNLSDDEAPVFLPAEIVEPAKALDVDLPEGPWSDQDLERFSMMMDSHFADAKSKGERMT